MHGAAENNTSPLNISEAVPMLVEIYGIRLLRFVLALSDTWEIGDELTEEQASVASALHDWARMFQHLDPSNRWANLASLLTRHVAENDASIASVMREKCGGSLQIPEREGDEVFSALVKYARDAYAALLIDRPGGDWVLGNAYHGPDDQASNARFFKAALADPQLRSLFPEHLKSDPEGIDFSELRRVDSLVFFECGQGGSFQLPLLAFHMLNSAYIRCSIEGDDSFSSYIESVSRTLSDARAMAAGGVAKVPVVLGFSNVSLSHVGKINLPGGCLREVSSQDRCYLPPQVTVDALLVLEMPMKISAKAKHPKSRDDEDSGVWECAMESSRRWQNSLQWSIDCHRLAFMLANRETHRSGAVQVLQAVVNPLHATPFVSWNDGSVQTSATRMEIKANEIDDFRQWVENVTSRHPRSLRVAMRRILSAAVARTDPSDTLVDAVLAWENMFSDSPETSLRVCGSLSILMEPSDRSRRRDINKELTRIYSSRSAIVHGSAREPSIETVIEHGDRALEVAVEAMRRLYKNPELLNSQTASARGKDVLLGLIEIK
ncbi:HEPN domain-containing protein [Streptomyces sp. S465]|uniref:HEPN domain-containing protein n=1 Tax=Streptomyces sp. S465 TaxID=2979468 RepID=UPI0022A86AD9|nr:HEPN domain-containing protein [Streptomyces sp. S465]WAP57031.1 HEPN domain-containing protein [Streptomyces sp. S465]